MSNEINTATAPGQTVYALLFNKTGKVWDVANDEFVAYATADRDDYDIALTEQGTSSGIYYADFPSITAAGSYEFLVYIQSGGAPAEPTTDTLASSGIVDWTGTSEVSAGSGSMTASDWRDYVLRGGYKRTTDDTQLYESTTDAIQELRRRFGFDEAHVDSTTTDTIATLGDFQLDIESDLGLVLDLTVQDGEDATPIDIVSKAEFDRLYPDIHVTNHRGYPKYACLYASKIYLGSIPDKLSYAYRINYSKRAGTVTSSTTAVPFTDLYRDVLRLLVLAYLYEAMDAFDKAQYFESKFERKYIEMERRERLNQKTGKFNVTPTNE